MSDSLNNFNRTIESICLSADTARGFANLAVRNGLEPTEVYKRFKQASEHLLELSKMYAPQLDPYYDSRPEHDFRISKEQAGSERLHNGG
jgi:hypothetical protein